MAHPPAVDVGTPQDFAKTFGDALKRFLGERHMRQSEAARLIGLEGTNGKSRINSYCRDSRKGTRTMADAEIFYLLCAKLGFHFDHRGYRIVAVKLDGKRRKVTAPVSGQLTFKFDRQFNLTDHTGNVGVKVKRPPGRIELSVSLKAAAP
jgi:transcriptional regulator with XRE-family HTH domain